MKLLKEISNSKWHGILKIFYKILYNQTHLLKHKLFGRSKNVLGNRVNNWKHIQVVKNPPHITIPIVQPKEKN